MSRSLVQEDSRDCVPDGVAFNTVMDVSRLCGVYLKLCHAWCLLDACWIRLETWFRDLYPCKLSRDVENPTWRGSVSRNLCFFLRLMWWAVRLSGKFCEQSSLAFVFKVCMIYDLGLFRFRLCTYKRTLLYYMFAFASMIFLMAPFL